MMFFETLGVIVAGVVCLLAAKRLVPAGRKPPRTPGQFA